MATVQKSMSRRRRAFLELQKRNRCAQWCSSERKPCHHTKEHARGGCDEDTHWNQGIEKYRLRARDTMYWCGINADNLVKKCNVCQQNQTAQQKEELIPIDATHPWEVVGSDMFHLRGDEYLFVVDYYSSYTIIRKLSSTTSGAIVSKLKLIFPEFGIPDIFIIDNARQYDSDEFRKFEAEYDFKHETSSPRYPQCNGKAARCVGVVKKTLQKAYEAREDPAIALLCRRTTPIETGLPSPAEMLFGYGERKSTFSQKRTMAPTI